MSREKNFNFYGTIIPNVRLLCALIAVEWVLEAVMAAKEP
jgi:hypothetical protein